MCGVVSKPAPGLPAVQPLEPRSLLSAGLAHPTLQLAPGSTTVVARHLFYNHSAYDRGARADLRDDTAIAADKAALLPGQPISAANFTSYARGINGVMIDVSGLPADSVLAAKDFDFKAG